MSTIIFVAVEAEPLDRLELGEAAVVADLLGILEGRGFNRAEVLVFREDHHSPLEHHHPLHGFDNPVFHVSRHREIEVTVNYALRTLQHRFAPSVTVAALTRWAVQQAGLGSAEAEEHVLQLCATREQPPAGAHLGSLAHHGRPVAFDLVRKKLVQG